jgi:hypothetical protein
MEIPGGETGVRRIGAQPSLQYPFSSRTIKPSPYYARYWWSWRRLRYLVSVIKTRGIENGAEWQRLAFICQIVSHRKKGYLYRELSSLFSDGSLSYLFGPEFIADHIHCEGVLS